MRKTIWLHNNHIDELVSLLTRTNHEISKAILEELELAYARASSNRILNKNFIKILEKDNSLPIRLSGEELKFLLGLKLTEDLFNELEANND